MPTQNQTNAPRVTTPPRMAITVPAVSIFRAVPFRPCRAKPLSPLRRKRPLKMQPYLSSNQRYHGRFFCQTPFFRKVFAGLAEPVAREKRILAIRISRLANDGGNFARSFGFIFFHIGNAALAVKIRIVISHGLVTDLRTRRDFCVKIEMDCAVSID